MDKEFSSEPPSYDQCITSQSNNPYPITSTSIIQQPAADTRQSREAGAGREADAETSSLVEIRPKVIMINGVPYDQFYTEKGRQMVRRWLGERPKTITCQFCFRVIVTETQQMSTRELLGDETYRETRNRALCIFLIPPLFIFLPCVWYLIKRGGIVHKCPKCNEFIGININGRSNFFYTPGSLDDQYARMRTQSNRY